MPRDPKFAKRLRSICGKVLGERPGTSILLGFLELGDEACAGIYCTVHEEASIPIAVEAKDEGGGAVCGAREMLWDTDSAEHHDCADVHGDGTSHPHVESLVEVLFDKCWQLAKLNENKEKVIDSSWNAHERDAACVERWPPRKEDAD
jgi:hypothetical protein